MQLILAISVTSTLLGLGLPVGIPAETVDFLPRHELDPQTEPALGMSANEPRVDSTLEYPVNPHWPPTSTMQHKTTHDQIRSCRLAWPLLFRALYPIRNSQSYKCIEAI